MNKIIEYTIDDLENYRYCPTFYKIKKEKDSSLIRQKPNYNIFYESVRKALGTYFEGIFKTNNDPKEKAFLTIVMRVFDAVSNMTKEEKFLNSNKIDSMLKMAKHVFSLSEGPLDNILCNPIKYVVHMGFGEYQVQGNSFPIVKYKGKPCVFAFSYPYDYCPQMQFTDIGMAGFILWLYDNMKDVRTIIQLNPSRGMKGFTEFPICYDNVHLIHNYFEHLCQVMNEKKYFPSSFDKCNNCLGSCVNFI